MTLHYKSTPYSTFRTLFLAFSCVTLFTSFREITHDISHHTVTKTITTLDGNRIEKTVVLFNKKTTREDVINACTLLAKENVQLTFEKLTIGKSLLGIVGKQRIKYARGKIVLDNGETQTFEAGGVTNFRSLTISFSRDIETKKPRLEMVEIAN
jgi:hypothetical protein